tara:strand:+ start:132 stop:395 length:264 start_codon:yes stop_codon:yes gene_type:complete
MIEVPAQQIAKPLLNKDYGSERGPQAIEDSLSHILLAYTACCQSGWAWKIVGTSSTSTMDGEIYSPFDLRSARSSDPKRARPWAWLR